MSRRGTQRVTLSGMMIGIVILLVQVTVYACLATWWVCRRVYVLWNEQTRVDDLPLGVEDEAA